MYEYAFILSSNVSVQAEARFGADSLERLVGAIIHVAFQEAGHQMCSH